jgi:hypothetical protein
VTDSQPTPASAAPASDTAAPRRKGPLSFLSGALTAGLLSWLCLGLSRRLALYYALHPPSYSSAIAQSIATALKTLIVGMAFLATFSFGFIALGLGLVFLRSLLPAAAAAAEAKEAEEDEASPAPAGATAQPLGFAPRPEGAAEAASPEREG